jgi:carboxyl-terminal processing protease
VPAVPYEITFDGKVGYVPLDQFNENATSEIVESVRRLQNAGARGIVLDLRNNPGGFLDQALSISNLFLRQGQEIASVRGRNSEPQMYFAREKPMAPDIPLVILTNQYTASASEIVAGALQDHKRAIIMGTQTFGKGSVQTILPLGNNTAIKLTTARYFTPNGRSIQAKGIQPDIQVEEATIAEAEQGLRMREADLERHLSNPAEKGDATDTPKPAKPGAKEGTTPETKADKPEPAEFGSKGDYQMNQALNLLKGLQIISKR